MFWLELKTSTKVNKAKLSAFQKSWHFSHARQGGRSFIMHQILEERLICLFPSSIVVSIAALSPQHASKTWAHPASQAAWAEMLDYILHSPLSIAQKPLVKQFTSSCSWGSRPTCRASPLAESRHLPPSQQILVCCTCSQGSSFRISIVHWRPTQL